MSDKAIRVVLNIISGLFGIVMIVLGVSDSNGICLMLGIWFTASALSDVLMSDSIPDYNDAEKFLQEEKDIYSHPYLTNRNKDNSYDVADLLVEFALKYKGNDR